MFGSNFTNLPLPALRTFVAIHEAKGFTAAAEDLGLTQPNVSQQVKRLERTLGKPLFVRGRRQAELTTAGETLLEYARPIVSLNDQAVSRLTASPVAGSLRLGLPHEFTTSILPELVGDFSQTHDGVAIQVDCELSKTLLANIHDYDVIIALHDEPEGSGSGTRVRKEPLSWVSSLGYQLPSETKPIDVIVAPDPCIYRDTLTRALASENRKSTTRLTSTSYSAVCAAVSTGMGITVLARSVVPPDLRILEDVGLPQLPDVDLRLHHDASKVSDATDSFVQFVRERLTA